MKEIIMKPFEMEGAGYWNDPKGVTKGVLRIFPVTMEIEVEMFSGCNPLASDLFNFIIKDKDVRLLIRQYQQSGRKIPYAINISSGMSGREDVYINFYDKYGLEICGKHLLHISCAGKTGGIKRMYIGDFAEAVYAYGIGEKTTARYIKPYFAEAYTDVHRIV